MYGEMLREEMKEGGRSSGGGGGTGGMGGLSRWWVFIYMGRADGMGREFLDAGWLRSGWYGGVDGDGERVEIGKMAEDFG